MSPLQVGTWAPFLLFTVVPAVALGAAIALSAYEVYRIGERKLLLLIAILVLMLQHQLLEAYAVLQPAGSVTEGLGEIFETGANLIASGSVYYVLRFAGRERRAVREIAESGRQYRTLIDESPVPILLHGDGEIQYANDAAVDLLGADGGSAVTGLDLAEFLHDERPEAVRDAVLTDRGSDVVETQVETLDDRSRYVALTSAPADYETEEVRQVVVRDLTERKRREREYEQIFNSVHDAIVIHDPETMTMVDVNDSLCELLGYDREEVLELGTAGVSVSDEGYTQERVHEVITEVMAEGERGPLEWKVETSDGDKRTLEVRATTAEIGGETRHLSINRDVTEQKRREREFEQIFNNVNDAISINDPETGAIVRVNDTMCELLGYDRDEILEMGVDGVSKTDEGFTQAAAKRYFDELAENEDAEQSQWAVETSDGETRWLEVSATLAEIGGQRRFITTNRDITERKRREREYEQIFDNVTDAITVFHPETAEILDVNETYYDLLGYDSLERIQDLGIEGLSVTDAGYTAEAGQELIREVGRTGETKRVEWCGETKHGERVWLDVTLTAAEIGGEPRVLSIQRDVTERKRREREYEQIFDSVKDGIGVWDPETMAIIDANEAYLEMMGYDDITDLRKQGVDGLSVTDDGFTEERGREIHRRVTETGEPELVEWRATTNDGDRLWLEVKVTPAVIGGEARTIAINRDVTERKRREQRLEVFNRILRHNLRNQLDVIRTHGEILADRTEGDHAEQLIASTDRLAAMGQRARTIDHFMSREIRAARIDISALVHDTLESIEPDAHGTTVELDLAEDTSLVTDAEILETVVSNAIDNAARYAESEVRIRGRHTDDGYVLEIADDGPGIPADELAPLDAETETEFTHGRGLGLWQLKWGVTKLNGSLSFDTNHGTTVRITVPDMGDRAGQG